LEASALTTASQRGLLARRSPLLKLQGDDRLIAMARNGNPGAFETIVDRYQGRLLGFCRQMLGSTEDAEDVLQEVFVNAYRAMLADEREINLRPWLYRIARNRCLNHLRKPRADAQESMDMVPAVEASSTAERVHNREEFRQLLTDVSKLPETQRSALLLREMDALSYEEIAVAMDTSVPSVKSLLVRARISLAEASQSRLLTCGDVRLELAEAAEGLRKVSGPVRRHVRECDECTDFRTQVRTNEKALAALFPVGPLLAMKGFILGKLGFGGAASGGTGAAGVGTGAAGVGAVGSVGVGGAALGTGGGAGAVGAALGTKAVAGVVTAAVLTAGAVEVKQQVIPNQAGQGAAIVSKVKHHGPIIAPAHQVGEPTSAPPAPVAAEPAPAPEPVPVVNAEPPAASTEAPTDGSAAGESDAVTALPDSEAVGGTPPAGAHPAGGATATVVVTVGGTPTETSPPPSSSSPPPASDPPPAADPPPADPPPAGSGSSSEETPPPDSSSTSADSADEPAAP
jgi:RNA polymerase sigma factor (sigma-70 family)